MSWKDIYKTYQDYLESDDWKYLREKMINLRKVCEICGTNKKLLVHHKNYDRVPQEKSRDLMVLCWDCHYKLHHGGESDIKTTSR